jgi:hypothetical protein
VNDLVRWIHIKRLCSIVASQSNLHEGLTTLVSECEMLLVIPVSCSNHHSLVLAVNPFGLLPNTASALLHLDSTGELWCVHTQHPCSLHIPWCL